jgi:hypothetical protein
MVRPVLLAALLVFMSGQTASADFKSQGARIIIEYGRKLGVDLAIDTTAAAIVAWLEHRIQTDKRAVSGGEIETELVLSKLCEDETVLARLDFATASALHCEIRLSRPAYDECVVNRFTADPPVDTVAPYLPLGEKARCCLFNPKLPGCYGNPEAGGDYE